MVIKKRLAGNRKQFRFSKPQFVLSRTGLLRAILLGSAGLFSATALAAEWTTPGGTLDGQRYSALNNINATNVGTLVEDFSVDTGAKGSHMGEPLVVGSTLYVVTPFPNKLIAYDLANKGAILWTYTPKANKYAKGVNCCDAVNRGAAYSNGKIVFNVLDNTTVAVDAVKGTELWRNTTADVHSGVTMAGAPIIVNGKVIVGTVSGEMGVRGWVLALDLATGKELWRGYNTGPDKDVLINSQTKLPYTTPGKNTDLGQKSWPGNTWQQGGSSAWAYLTYDKDTDTVFYGTSQPGVWNPEVRPGDNKWGASIFARDPNTGAVKWVYQVTPHDNWDYDAISENIPVNLPLGKHSNLLVHFNKNGFAYAFDRSTGEIISAEQFVKDVNWASGIDLTTGLPMVNPDKFTHTGKTTSGICPSALGGKGWEPGSFSPSTGLFYMPTFNLCMKMHMLKAEYVYGAPYMAMDMAIEGAPTDPTYTSELIAWDIAKGKAFGLKEPSAIYGGVLSTAGNLVFYGTQDKVFKAIDARPAQAVNGVPKVLWSTKMECSTVGNPITFTVGQTNEQRIAVFSGVGAMAGGFGGGACTGKAGGKVHVYKLK
jgi:alcohol dehydrogenase (cytochrome c)